MRLTGRLNQITDFPSPPSPGTGMRKSAYSEQAVLSPFENTLLMHNQCEFFCLFVFYVKRRFMVSVSRLCLTLDGRKTRLGIALYIVEPLELHLRG